VLNQQVEDQEPGLAKAIQTIPLNYGTYALIYRCDAPFQALAGKLGPVSIFKRISCPADKP
jgi:hypothetical protein